MLKLQLTHDGAYDDEYLELPATPAEVGEVMSRLDETSTDVASTRIYGTISDIWNIGNYLKRADVNDATQLKKLNRIGELTCGLSRDECLLFQGGLDSESINGLDDVIDVGEHLDRYLLVRHVTSDRELGLCLVSYGIKPFDESVQPYLDYARIGIEYYANHGGAYTSGGYVLRRDSAEQTLRDIVDARNNRQTLGAMRME
mgnify:FL=1